jgi:hypothetical protein
MGQVELAHPPEILDGEASNVRECPDQVAGEPSDDGVSPPRVGLLLDDGRSEVPIEQHGLPADRANGLDARGLDPRLQRGQERRVVVGHAPAGHPPSPGAGRTAFAISVLNSLATFALKSLAIA